MTAKEYLSQRYNYGGILLSLGAIIQDLRRCLPEDMEPDRRERCVGLYILSLTSTQQPVGPQAPP